MRIILVILLINIGFVLNAQSVLSNLANWYYLEGRYGEAIRLETEALKVFENTVGRVHPDYAGSLSNLAWYYSRVGNHAEALRLGTEALGIQKKILGREHPDYAASLYLLSIIYESLGNYTEAIRLGTEALEIREKILGREHPDYASSLGSLAGYYADLGNYAEAIRLGTEEREIIEKVLGREHPCYAISLGSIASYYADLGNYAEAIRLGTEERDIIEKVLGREHPCYAISLGCIADYYGELGNYVEAIKLGTEALEIVEKILGREHPDYAASLNNISTYYNALGNYTEAIRLRTEALEIRERILGREHPDYAATLGSIAGHYADLGNYVDAIKLGTEALEIVEKILGREHPECATLLNNISTYYNALGNYTEAIRLGTEALEIREKILGREHRYYATSLINLANYNGAQGNYTETIRLVIEALEIIEKLFGQEHPEYAMALSNLATSYGAIGNYTEAIRLGTEALEIREKILGREHPDYAITLSNLASSYGAIGNYAEAIRLKTEALGIWVKVFGQEHPYYVKLLESLADDYYTLDRQEEVLEIVMGLFPIECKNVTCNFKYLSKTERQSYWEMQKSFFSSSLPCYVWKYPSELMITTMLDAILFSKGILLNSEVEFNKLLSESGSSNLKNKYEEIKLIRLQLNRLYEKPIAERHADMDSLERRANKLEMQLMQESSEFWDYTRNISIPWMDVRNNLNEKDAAIEFVNFPLSDDSIMYMACVVRPNMRHPTLVKLFEEKDLSSLSDEDLYKTTKGCELIWAKLQSELDGAENLYFAPDGILHQIGIEYFPDFENSHKHIYDRYHIYRLSSTRQIAMKKHDKSVGNAIIYGGIQYDSDTQTMAEESRKYDIASSRSIKPRYNWADTMSMRGGVNYLSFTLTEASLVSELLKRANQQYQLMTGIEATEESVKSLSGKKNSLIHIATHGFYWEKDDADYEAGLNDKLSFMLDFGDADKRNIEDKALTRTGLYMAGVNNVLKGKEIPESVEDGILTAQEIANLDLRGLDLVVLSACQTGMGDISGDGVFGLQRGFKKAGANSILMSLWDVDDEATQILMTEFYKNYLAGKSKYESLRLAQNALRSDPKYSDPQYWAAFILLDGLN